MLLNVRISTDEGVEEHLIALKQFIAKYMEKAYKKGYRDGRGDKYDFITSRGSEDL